MGGVDVSSASPPSLVVHALGACSAATKQEAKRAPRRRRATRPKIDQEEKPQNQKNKGRGWVRIRDIERPRIHSTLFSGPMVYTLFPCFPRKRVYTIAFFALWPGGRATDRKRRDATVVVYTLFSPEEFPRFGRRISAKSANLA